MTPDDLMYTRTHEWVRIEDNEAVVGITDFAQDQLGDLTFIELPEVGDVLSSGNEMGTIESVKAASEIYSPVDGEVIAVNEELEDAPEMVNESPYDDGWLIRVALQRDPEDLLSADEYEAFLAEESV